MKRITTISKLYFVSILFSITAYAQVGHTEQSQQIDLSVINISFPDTVQIGETVVLEGYIKNESNSVFESNILMNYDIEDTKPEDYEEDDETDEEEILENVILQPGEILAFSRSIQINSTRFISNTQDVVIIWPETHRITDPNTANNYGVKEVFVKEAPIEEEELESEDDENDEDEDEDDENEEDEDDENEEDEDEDEEDEEDDDNDEKNQGNNLEVIKDKKIIEIQPQKAGKNNRIMADLNSAEIEIFQQNRQLKININNRDMEVLNFSLYTFNGHLLFTDKAHEYLIRQTMDLLPVISVVNYRLKSSPNKVNTFTKSIILK